VEWAPSIYGPLVAVAEIEGLKITIWKEDEKHEWNNMVTSVSKIFEGPILQIKFSPQHLGLTMAVLERTNII
jgi:hypothetical protein